MPGKHCVGETWRGSIPLPSSGVDMLMMDEIYVSTDVETDGPIPGPYSMLSIGSVAYALSQENGRLERVRLGEFSANLETLPGASSHPEVMDWWAKQPAAWEACRKNLEAPRDAMRRYYEWVSQLPGIKLGNKGDVKNAVFVGYPSGFDFTFVFWYFMSFVGESPFGFAALDVKSYASAHLRQGYFQTTKKTMPKEWFPKDMAHTHVAVEDAAEQGELFMNILIRNLSGK